MTRLLRSLSALALMVLLPVVGVQAASITLYDDTQTQTPNQQDWLFAASNSTPFPFLPNQTAGSAGVTMVTTLGESAGYSNYTPFGLKNTGFPALDRGAGFSLSFEVQINSESHTSNDRAGFSVILLADDLWGVELGFWTDTIWAQSTNFVHQEELALDTQTSEVLYDLSIQGSGYVLTGGGKSLSGSLRKYADATPTPSPNPYILPSYLFLGDDTSRGAADIILGEVILSTNPAAAPAPPAWGLLLLGLGLIGRRYRLRAR